MTNVLEYLELSAQINPWKIAPVELMPEKFNFAISIHEMILRLKHNA